MDDRFRSSVTIVPNVRIGVGRAGVTTTIGWGNHASRTAGVSLATIGDPRFSGPLPTDRFLIPGTREEFGTGDIGQMTSPGLASFKALLEATRQRRLEIGAETARAKLQLIWAWALRAIGWISLASVVVPGFRRSAQTALDTRRAEIAVLKANMVESVVSVDFDMDTEVGPPHHAMHDAFEAMRACGAVWSIDSTQRIDRAKARSFAGTVVQRHPARLARGAHPLVGTSEAPLTVAFSGGRSVAHFYPGFVLVAARDAGAFALVDLRDLEIQYTDMHFTECEALPHDATLVGKTWAKANKDGSRDRRFSNNRELPIARYGEVHLAGPGGLRETLMVSRHEPGMAFCVATRELKGILASAGSAKRLGSARALPSRN
jgi:hypothetical protein